MAAWKNLRPPSEAWQGRRKTAPSPALVEQLSNSPKLMARRNSADSRYTTVGICAMAKKIQAAPMQSILARLRQQEYIKLVVFSDHTILKEPVEQWPLCNCLIAFYSKGFPLKKAIDYVKLRGPMVINDLQMQYALMDRRKVYEILQRHGVEVPKYVVLNRPETESSSSSGTLIETDDTIEVQGHVFHKPFVEKPISAEDHTVHIYFPSDYGGGCQQLFRKVKDRSSTYSKQSTVRKTGSYIYEEFMPTDGTDVKVYTVGPDYAHAEARKSPALDGKVERDEQGKEKRYPVFLTAREKLIARQVCLAFKQTVCGFDLLRTNGKSYVCDVNGFSFVKNSHKYYEDCAQILLEMITASLAPDHIPHVPPSVEYMAEEVPVPIPRTGNTLELRCVIGVIRHGDRTPKQKMKMIVKHKKFFELFEELDGYKTGHVKIKKPKQLQKVLDIARYLLENIEKYHESHEITEKEHKLQQLKSVLEMYGYFSGINRKVQFKLVKNKMGAPLLLLILKWGGELTPAGQKQAEELGRAFRCMYPGGAGEYASLPGSGFLRLHSTYRHDLKVYASDEGRVQMTAAAFTKGLLDLEGNLASVLVHLVKRDQNATNMLDTSTSAQEAMLSVKEKLHGLLRSPANFTKKSFEDIAPTGVESVVSAMKNIKSPREACEQLHEKIRALLKELNTIPSNVTLYRNEPLQMMMKRWAKLDKDLKMLNGQFDISKIPDIYDCIKYDLQHNSHLGLKNANDLFHCAMNLADLVIPQEYGITEREKLDIATKICSPLLRKVQSDLQHTIVNGETDIIYRLNPHLSRGVITPNRHVRTRLYFTSESHVHSMLNILRYGNLVDNPDTPEWKGVMKQVSSCPELNYMTQIVIMLYEDFSQPLHSEQRYRVEIHFSPGVKGRLELLQKGCRQPKDLSLGFSSTDGAGTKISPDQASKSPMWVKRLPATLVEGTVRQSNATILGSKSTPTVLRKISDPMIPKRSNSEVQLKKQMPQKSLSSVQLMKQKSLSFIHESEPLGLQSHSDNLLDQTHSIKTGEDRGTLAEEDSGIANLISANPQEGHVLFTTNGEDSFSKTTHHGLEEKDLLPGLELAAELASTVEPLIPIWSAPLSKMNTFLTKITGVTFDYKSEPTTLDSLSLGTPTPSTPSPPPHPLHSPQPPTSV